MATQSRGHGTQRESLVIAKQFDWIHERPTRPGDGSANPTALPSLLFGAR
jgi:hypothetical protein